jgi:hypothetical protein
MSEHDLRVRESSESVTGIVLGTLGAGFASCGSVLLAGLLSLVGAGVVLTLLPPDGMAFVFVALVGVVLSIYWFADGLRGGIAAGCPVDV